jgi:CRP-like cAMP-binding protein
MGNLDRSLVAHFPFFAGFSETSLDEILENAHSARYPKDSHIFEQGEDAKAFFFLLHGHVRAVRTTPDGQQIIARYIGAGEIFGIAPAIGRSTYPASAVAAVDCLALSWPAALWSTFAQQHPQLARNTFHTVGDRLQETQDRVVELSVEGAEQRIAKALLRLAKQSGRETLEGTLIDFPLSRQDIAQMTGTTLFTASRILSNWTEEGTINSGRQRVTIVRPQALQAIAIRRTKD